MDIQSYSEELQQLAVDYRGLAFEYKKERALYAEAENVLINLIYKSGLFNDKAEFKNKFAKLLSTQYGDQAKPYISQLLNSRANYKGLGEVMESYKTQISAIQSVIKWNLQGELNNAVAERNM